MFPAVVTGTRYSKRLKRNSTHFSSVYTIGLFRCIQDQPKWVHLLHVVLDKLSESVLITVVMKGTRCLRSLMLPNGFSQKVFDKMARNMLKRCFIVLRSFLFHFWWRGTCGKTKYDRKQKKDKRSQMYFLRCIFILPQSALHTKVRRHV